MLTFVTLFVNNICMLLAQCLCGIISLSDLNSVITMVFQRPGFIIRVFEFGRLHNISCDIAMYSLLL